MATKNPLVSIRNRPPANRTLSSKVFMGRFCPFDLLTGVPSEILGPKATNSQNLSQVDPVVLVTARITRQLSPLYLAPSLSTYPVAVRCDVLTTEDMFSR